MIFFVFMAGVGGMVGAIVLLGAFRFEDLPFVGLFVLRERTLLSVYCTECHPILVVRELILHVSLT